MAHRRLLRVTLLAAGLVAVPIAHAQYGELAPGAMSEAEVGDVHAEICVDHLMDPRSNTLRLPTGYRLIEAASRSTQDPLIGALVKRDTELAKFVMSTLCFVSADRFVVDGAAVHASGPTRMAFWWVYVDAPAESQRDARMKGDVPYVQLASWYARQGADRARILRFDPMAQFVDLDIARADTDSWRLRISLPTETIDGEVRLSGLPVPMNRPTPGYVTLPFGRKHAAYFQVFTFFGHHERPATGTWRAQGSGAFTRAMGNPGNSLVFGTVFEDGWQTRSALYKLAR